MIAAGGLHIIGTERHESRRIDNQLRGRSGRQGDPGSSRFYLSLEDNLMRIFGDPTRMKSLMTRVGMKAGEAIESGMLTRQIERAQRRVEQHNFDARKQLLEYDDVANDQRRVIYQQRTDLMSAEDVAEAIVGIREEVVDASRRPVRARRRPGGPVGSCPASGGHRTRLRRAAARRGLGRRRRRPATVRAEAQDAAALEQAYAAKRANVGPDVMRYIEKEVMLQHPRPALARASRGHGLHAPGHLPAQLRAEEPEAGIQARGLRAVLRDARPHQVRHDHARFRRSRCAARPRSSRRNSSGSSASRAPCSCSMPRPFRRSRAWPGGAGAPDGGMVAARIRSRRFRPRRRPRRAVRPRRAQGGAQRALPLRFRAQVQALPRRFAASQRLNDTAREIGASHARARRRRRPRGRGGARAARAAPAGKHLAGGWEFPGRQDRARRDAYRRRSAANLREEIGVTLHAAHPLIRVRHAYPERDIDLDVWLVTRYSGEPHGLEGQPLTWCERADLPARESHSRRSTGHHGLDAARGDHGLAMGPHYVIPGHAAHDRRPGNRARAARRLLQGCCGRSRGGRGWGGFPAPRDDPRSRRDRRVDGGTSTSPFL